jgi:hypothetical protein
LTDNTWQKLRRPNLALACFVAAVFGCATTTSLARADITLTRGNIQTTTPVTFKRFGWPSGTGPAIVRREVTMQGTMWPPLTPPRVEVFQAPTPLGRRLCQRVSYVLPLQWRDQDLFYSELNSGRPASVTDRSHLVLSGEPGRIIGVSIAPNCRVGVDQKFAPMSANITMDTIAALTMLDEAHHEVQSAGLVGFSVQCETRSGPNRCSATPRESLAQLPVKLVWNVQQGNAPNSYEFWAGNPGQLVWVVIVVFSKDKRVESVSMTSLIPLPF